MRLVVRFATPLLVLAFVPVFSGSLSAAALSSPRSCARTQVTLTATPDQSLYPAGTPVHVTVTLHNHSTKACSYATGTFSPSYSLVNAAGVAVWGACWYNGGPAPCAYVLVHRVLAPGATYTDRLTWDQRTGHPDQPVPAGRYRFSVSVSGIQLVARTTFSVA